MTRGGSDLGSALREAIKAFPSENNVKAIVLLTDGEDLGGQLWRPYNKTPQPKALRSLPSVSAPLRANT